MFNPPQTFVSYPAHPVVVLLVVVVSKVKQQVA